MNEEKQTAVQPGASPPALRCASIEYAPEFGEIVMKLGTGNNADTVPEVSTARLSIAQTEWVIDRLRDAIEQRTPPDAQQDREAEAEAEKPPRLEVQTVETASADGSTAIVTVRDKDGAFLELAYTYELLQIQYWLLGFALNEMVNAQEASGTMLGVSFNVDDTVIPRLINHQIRTAGEFVTMHLAVHHQSGSVPRACWVHLDPTMAEEISRELWASAEGIRAMRRKLH